MTSPIDNDPFEEFEFKPLTEGLGFHNQKKAEAKTEARGESAQDLKFEARRSERRPDPTRASSPKSFVDDLLDLSTLDSGKLDRPLLKTPLLKRSTPSSEIPAPAPLPVTSKVEEVMKSLQKHNWDFNDTQTARKNLKAAPEYSFRPSNYDLSALILDSMLVIAGFLGSLIVLLMVTRVDLVAAVTTSSTELLVLAFFSLLGSICWIYLTVNRLFLGATPGEWVFDQRLGAPEVQGTATFALKAVARATLILLSGLVVFPILSLFADHDLLGRWMGLELHQKNLK